MNTFDLRLDLDKGLTPKQVVRIRQGDELGTTIAAAIFDHGTLVTTAPDACRIAMRLPDGTHYYRKAATWADGTATVTIDETQAASAVGRTSLAYFQLTYGTDLLSTGAFAVIVEPDALADATVPESYDSAIQDAIDNLSEAVEQLPSTVEDVLTAHPEWTTTVQDGSITQAKLATDLAHERERLLYRLANLLTNALPEGDVATATDAAKTPLAGLALYGRSTQAGTPTPSAPVAIQSVATANLLDDGAPSEVTSRGITVTPESDGWFRVSGTSTGTNAGVTTIWGSSDLDLPAGTYTAVVETDGTPFVASMLRLQVYGSSVLAYISDAGTYPLNATTAITRIGIHFAAGSAGTVVDGRFRIAIYAGSTPLPYVPYGNAGLWAKRTSDASTYTVTPIPLDGHELRSLPDGTRDEVTVDERGHAVLVQRVGEATPQGESAIWSTRESDGRIVIRVPDIKPTTGNNEVSPSLSDRFVFKSINAATATGDAAAWPNEAGDRARVSLQTGASGISSIQAAAAWLAANPVTLLYPLATPVTHDLGTIDPTALVGPDLTAQAVPTAPFALTYERDLNVTLARLESAIANLV